MVIRYIYIYIYIYIHRFADDFGPENRQLLFRLDLCLVCSDAEKAKLDDVIVAMIRKGDSNVVDAIANPIFDKRKLIDWKVRHRFSVQGWELLKNYHP